MILIYSSEFYTEMSACMCEREKARETEYSRDSSDSFILPSSSGFYIHIDKRITHKYTFKYKNISPSSSTLH